MNSKNPNLSVLKEKSVGFIKRNRRLPSPHNVQSGPKFFQIDDFAELAELQSPWNESIGTSAGFVEQIWSDLNLHVQGFDCWNANKLACTDFSFVLAEVDRCLKRKEKVEASLAHTYIWISLRESYK
jgi:hypothetical protein